MVNSELLRNDVTIEPMTAVKMPATGGKPEALATPRQSGNAIKKTRKPAMMS